MLTLDMPTTLSVSSGSVFLSPNLRYDNSKKDSYLAQYVDSDGFFTELGRQLADVQELSATEGIQLLQDCIMAAAQNTYQKAKSANYQPKDKNAELMMNAELLLGNMKRLCKIPLAMWQSTL